MTTEEFAELEAETWHLYDEHVDAIRIRGFASALDGRVTLAQERLDKALAALERARKRAEQELRAFERTCEFTENMARFAARVMAGDVSEESRRAVASLIEEAIG